MEQFHGTTILSVRRGASVALGGDGQVTLGSVGDEGQCPQGAHALSRSGCWQGLRAARPTPLP